MNRGAKWAACGILLLVWFMFVFPWRGLMPEQRINLPPHNPSYQYSELRCLVEHGTVTHCFAVPSEPKVSTSFASDAKTLAGIVVTVQNYMPPCQIRRDPIRGYIYVELKKDCDWIKAEELAKYFRKD